MAIEKIDRERTRRARVSLAPYRTTLALSLAEAAGITLAGIVRDDGLEIFTGPSGSF